MTVWQSDKTVELLLLIVGVGDIVTQRPATGQLMYAYCFLVLRD
jgi:hypothetical protein